MVAFRQFFLPLLMGLAYASSASEPGVVMADSMVVGGSQGPVNITTLSLEELDAQLQVSSPGRSLPVYRHSCTDYTSGQMYTTISIQPLVVGGWTSRFSNLYTLINHLPTSLPHSQYAKLLTNYLP